MEGTGEGGNEYFILIFFSRIRNLVTAFQSLQIIIDFEPHNQIWLLDRRRRGMMTSTIATFISVIELQEVEQMSQYLAPWLFH